MTIFYSKSTNSFFDDEINPVIPSDAVEITQYEHFSLLNGQSNEKIISSDAKGNPILIDPPAPTTEETIIIYNLDVQAKLDSVSQSWGYDSIISAASYYASTNAQFKADAEALIAWRDSVWAEVYTIEQGNMPSTVEDFVAMLPVAPEKPPV